jgi:hypothetical protein
MRTSEGIAGRIVDPAIRSLSGRELFAQQDQFARPRRSALASVADNPEPQVTRSR